MFKDIKVGDTLYLLDIDATSGIPTYRECTVDKVVPEYIAPGATFNQNKVMDIVIKYPGSDGIELSRIDSSMTSLEAGKYKLGCTKSWAMNYVRNMHDVHKNHVASIDNYIIIERVCAEILAANGLNSVSDSERLTSLEKGFTTISTDIAEMKSMFGKLITNFKTNENAQPTSSKANNSVSGQSQPKNNGGNKP